MENYKVTLPRVRQEATTLNELNTFMASDTFPTLSREEKDLYYEQSRAMSNLVQILGKHLEFSGKKFTHKSDLLSGDE